MINKIIVVMTIISCDLALI